MLDTASGFRALLEGLACATKLIGRTIRVCVTTHVRAFLSLYHTIEALSEYRYDTPSQKGTSMPKSTKRIIVLTVAVIALLCALSQVLPTYNYVSLRGPDGELQVERVGFGAGNVQVETDGASIRSTSR